MTSIDVARWFVVAALFAGGCTSQGDLPHATASARRYHLEGEVVAVDARNRLLTIRHSRIAGYMDGMTMPFHVFDRGALGAAEPGSHIDATLVVDGDRSWLEAIALVSGEGARMEESPGAREGDEVPDFALVNQDGRPLSLKQLRGKAVALTFIYVRCPLPDFCPLISKHFAAAERILAASPALRDATALLSVSFDPDYDTPPVLKAYRAGFLGSVDERSASHWQCASGTMEQIQAITAFFGLQYFPDAGFAHSLRTVVIGPDGRITRVHPANDWTPEDLVAQLRDALEASGGH